jgi:hypothetical protein
MPGDAARDAIGKQEEGARERRKCLFASVSWRPSVGVRVCVCSNLSFPNPNLSFGDQRSNPTLLGGAQVLAFRVAVLQQP